MFVYFLPFGEINPFYDPRKSIAQPEFLQMITKNVPFV